MQRALAVVAIGVLGIVAEAVAFEPADIGRWLPDLAVGWSLAAIGMIARWRQPRSGAGIILFVGAIAWFAGNFAGTLTFVHRAVLAHAVLTLPNGRINSAHVAVARGSGICRWLLLGATNSTPILVATTLILPATAAFDWLRAPIRARRARLIALAAAVLLSGAYLVAAVVHVAVPSGRLDYLILLADEATIVVAAVAVLYAVLLPGVAADRLSEMVVELRGPGTDGVREALSRALGDPSLEVGYWDEPSNGFLDAAGQPVRVPDTTETRTATLVDVDGRPGAVLVHDPAVLESAPLLDAVQTLTRLSVMNAGLRTDVLDQISAVRASRARLLASIDEERTMLERRLENGPLRHAKTLEGHLASLDGEPVGAIRNTLHGILAELTALAQGLHPRTLEEAGFTAALRELAHDSAIPVTLDIDGLRPDVPERVALAAYYACSEAIANAVKHSGAAGIAVTVRETHESLEIEVTDDGTGGADAGMGSGLVGIADRAETLGGRFELQASAGAGTTVRIFLPLHITLDTQEALADQAGP